MFAAYLFSNNTGVAIMAFALGFAFGIPTLLLLVYNMALLGAMLWVFVDAGLGWEFAAWLSVHGTTELGAILLAGAAGLHVGPAMAFPGSRSIMAAAQRSWRARGASDGGLHADAGAGGAAGRLCPPAGGREQRRAPRSAR